MDWLLEPQTWIAFVTLVTLELVLGVDNVIFISILAGKLPAAQRQSARAISLGHECALTLGPSPAKREREVRRTGRGPKFNLFPATYPATDRPHALQRSRRSLSYP